MKNPSAPPPGVEPKYVWFAGYLRRQIEQGDLKPGDKLPSRTEIRERHHITQPTIERAQAILEREGLIVRRERQGIYVADSSAIHKDRDPNHSNHTGYFALDTIGILSTNEGEIKPGHRQFGWSDYITQGALEACREHKKHALLLNPARLLDQELEQLLAHPPLGFIFASTTSGTNFSDAQRLLKVLQRSDRPLVMFGNEPEFADFDRVACDHEAGCYELTRWLIGRGCSRILPFWPPISPGGDWLKERLAGYQRAMAEAGLEALPVREVPQHHLPNDPDDTQDKFDATTRHKAGYLADFLGSKRGCDAILEVTDGEVSTTAAACRLLGYEPNGDVLIAGYDNYWRDNVERAFDSTAPVATVDKHNWQAGREMVEVLLSRVAGKLGDNAHLHRIQPELLPLDGSAESMKTLANATEGVLER